MGLTGCTRSRFHDQIRGRHEDDRQGQPHHCLSEAYRGRPVMSDTISPHMARDAEDVCVYVQGS